ncbi:MAG TPA: hypothetical protein VN541_14875 [Tepidisphaeraceae bacterium]|nr:hypothetical protein [Tepidisphaeraceae bacterium]
MSITAILSAIATFLAGLVQAVNQYLSQKQAAQEVNTGVLQQTVAQEAAKANDQTIATRIDLEPTPGSKSDILAGM